MLESGQKRRPLPRKSGRGPDGPVVAPAAFRELDASVISIDPAKASLYRGVYPLTEVRKNRRCRDATTRAADSRSAAHLTERVHAEQNMTTSVSVAQEPAPILTPQVAALFTMQGNLRYLLRA